MRHSEFRIGSEFRTATGRWRCTDVGTRTVVAIRLDRPEDPSWYVGPPYAVDEVVFDEDDLPGCELVDDSVDRSATVAIGAVDGGALAGVDGCPAGWLAAILGRAGTVAFRVFNTFDEIVAEVAVGRIARVVIDVPIGLTESGPRRVDDEARALLGSRRSSVFAAPYRSVLTARSQREAGDLRERIDGSRVSIQAFNIYAKVREADAAMNPALQARIREGHPELTFRALAGGRPMRSYKKTLDGRTERLSVLATFFRAATGVPADAPAVKGAAPDDIVDALAMLATAIRWAAGTASVLPSGGEQVDSRGLRAEMVA